MQPEDAGLPTNNIWGWGTPEIRLPVISGDIWSHSGFLIKLPEND
jgi:hypothetical protein